MNGIALFALIMSDVTTAHRSSVVITIIQARIVKQNASIRVNVQEAETNM